MCYCVYNKLLLKDQTMQTWNVLLRIQKTYYWGIKKRDCRIYYKIWH